MTKKSKIVTVVISVVLLLAVTGLSIALGIIESKRKDGDARLNSVYEKSYFEAMDSLSDVEIKLSKVNVIQSSALKQQLLNDIWRECDVAASNLSQLVTESEESTNLIKFINQLGDYSYYLAVKLKSASLNEEEKTNLTEYLNIVGTVNESLISAHDKLINGDKIDSSVLTDYSLIADAIKNHSTVEYPEMIYDGPFSDGLNDREAKFLSGKVEVTQEQAAEKVKELFPDATDIELVGTSSASLPTYLFSLKNDGVDATAQITTIGGYLVMYSAFREVTDPVLSEEECVAKAARHLASFGYDDMKEVWVSNDDSTVYINFAYEQDGVIYYPDLIKLKICSQSGALLGMEAQNYLYNHTERTFSFPEQNSITLDPALTVTSQTYCVIPTEWNTELAAKEIVATKDDVVYYLYFDPESGEEIKVLVVIDENGKLLM